MIQEIFAEATSAANWVLAVLAFIIIAAPLVAERFRLPGMLGLVIGGMIFGPYMLGWLPEGSMDVLGSIGIFYLMFLAGAELDMNLFRRYKSAAVTFSLLTFIFPFTFSLLASRSIGLSWGAAILMGAVWASHTLVAYPTVRETGLASNKAVAVVVGATAITDTLSLLVLAMVSGMTSGETTASSSGMLIMLKLGLGLGLLLLYSMIFLPWLARRFFAGPGQERMLRFVFVFGAFISAGLLAEITGIEGLVGAFFAGIGLNRFLPNGGRLMEQNEFFASALFIPAFLVSVGMLIDPVVLFSISTLRLALLFGGALALGKFLAAAISGWKFKFSWAEIGVIFSLTIAQAAATLASTMVGLKIGLFDETVVNAVLLVVLVSLIVTSIGTLFFARKVKPESLVVRPLGISVIVPVHPSASLNRTLSLAANIAQADAGTITPVVVLPEYDAQHLRQEAENLLKQAEKFGAATTADVEGVLRIDASFPVGVIHELQERNGTLILIEWDKPPNTQQLLLGHEIDRIGTQSTVPVAAVRFAKAETQRIVLFTGTDDGSTGYHADLQVALQIATRIYKEKQVPLVVFSPQERVPEIRGLPKEAAFVTVEPGIKESTEHFRNGDLVVVPGAVIGRLIGSHASELLSAGKEVSVLVAAGPHRLNFSSARVGYETEAIISFGSTA